MTYRIEYWKKGERVLGAPLDDREAALHAALHLHAGEQCSETRVWEEASVPGSLFGVNRRIIMVVNR